ncbi:hypothetical protein Ciccas_000931 [Cichlidogyrus casuarinus]|uniref:Uncharacterized protein n=1 Tax=Cichlidogyrus casuarinus TaxID=1844966 RepID=A0ABD2QLG7_9PLAT
MTWRAYKKDDPNYYLIKAASQRSVNGSPLQHKCELIRKLEAVRLSPQPPKSYERGPKQGPSPTTVKPTNNK